MRLRALANRCGAGRGYPRSCARGPPARRACGRPSAAHRPPRRAARADCCRLHTRPVPHRRKRRRRTSRRLAAHSLRCGTVDRTEPTRVVRSPTRRRGGSDVASLRGTEHAAGKPAGKTGGIDMGTDRPRPRRRRSEVTDAPVTRPPVSPLPSALGAQPLSLRPALQCAPPCRRLRLCGPSCLRDRSCGVRRRHR